MKPYIPKHHGSLPVDLPHLPVIHHHWGVNHAHIQSALDWLIPTLRILGILGGAVLVAALIVSISAWIMYLVHRRESIEPETMLEFLEGQDTPGTWFNWMVITQAPMWALFILYRIVKYFLYI